MVKLMFADDAELIASSERGVLNYNKSIVWMWNDGLAWKLDIESNGDGYGEIRLWSQKSWHNEE